MNWLNNLFPTGNSPETVAWSIDALILDVRTPSEFAAGRVDGALNLPLDRFAREHAGVAPDKSRQIIVYCQSGARSGQALRFLKQQGYDSVINGCSAIAVAGKTNRTIVK